MQNNEKINYESTDNSKLKYQCNISFTTSKNLHKIFQEKKFLRIITLNNMVEGHNNIFIIREDKDIEANIGELQLECLLQGKSAENNAFLAEKVKFLEAENKKLKNLINKTLTTLSSKI